MRHVGEKKNAHHQKRQGLLPKPKGKLEQCLIVLVVGMAVIVTNVNVFLLSASNSSNNNANVEMATTPSKQTQRRAIVRNSALIEKNKSNGTFKRLELEKGPMLQTLRDAGVKRPAQLLELAKDLPTWKEVVDRYGAKPVIVGLDTCAAYRNTVPLHKRFVGIAGPFNSGTNYMWKLLLDNCKLPKRGPLVMQWQVNWGKHQSPKYRFKNYVYPNYKNENFLPIVMVRDPYSWMQSMCRSPYTAKWYHMVPHHCPNLVPNDVEAYFLNKDRNWLEKHYSTDRTFLSNAMMKTNFTLHSPTMPVRIQYKSYNGTHESLIHMWKDWYQDYYETTTTRFPRVMVRLEDVVYRPRTVLQQVCECAGGYVMDDLNITMNSAKDGHEQQSKTGLVGAMIHHVHANRTNNMTLADLEFSKKVLADSIMNVFQYPMPSAHGDETLLDTLPQSDTIHIHGDGDDHHGSNRRSVQIDPIVETLHNVGIQNETLLKEIGNELPKFEQVVERFGKDPIIVGLDRCKEFRTNVPQSKRFVGVAGAFNSGTNILWKLLLDNCNIPNRGKGSMRWQVNWGKHQSPKYRFNNSVYAGHDSEHFLPVVTVRDPYSWMQSMCRNRYSVHWYHLSSFHCPNLVPNNVERFYFNKSVTWLKEHYSNDSLLLANAYYKNGFHPDRNPRMPVQIAYKSYTAHHDSLIHMWKDWYQDYYDVTFPRLMIRMEDVAYHTKFVLNQVCQCVGGYLNETLNVTMDSAKEGHNLESHRIGWMNAMINHVRDDRTKNMTVEDIEFSKAVLKRSVMDAFGYTSP